MSAQRLSTKSLLELIDLFERSQQPLTGTEGQRLQGVPGWDLTRMTAMPPSQRAHWLDCIGYAGAFAAPCGDELVPVELEPDEDPARYRYRCPETFRWKFLDAAHAAVYAVRSEQLLHEIAELLEIPQALRHGVASPLLAGTLWHLGKARIGPAHTDVWFVRGLGLTVEAVFQHFHAPTLPSQGLILTSSQSLPEWVRPPRDYRIATLREVLVEHVTTPCIDRDLLQRLLMAPTDGTLRPALPVHFDEYTHTLTIRAKAKPWVIKGERQAAAVRYLFAQAQNGRWLLSAAEILHAAYPGQKSARSQRLQNLFSGNTDWEDYIANPEKGKYGFRLD